MKLFQHWFHRLRTFIDRPWYVLSVAFLAGLDLFILVVPTDGLVISSYFGKKKRLWGPITLVALGSAIGALALAALVQADVTFITDRLLAPLFHNDAWEAADSFLEKYGYWAVALSALCPVPQQPAVLLAALAEMPLTTLFLSFLVGRLLKYGFFAWSVRHLPNLVLRILSRENMTLLALRNGKLLKRKVSDTGVSLAQPVAKKSD